MVCNGTCKCMEGVADSLRELGVSVGRLIPTYFLT